MSMQRVRLVLDSNVRRSSQGTALIGGSPFRLIRLSSAGAGLLDAWLAGAATEASQAATALRRRLLDAGIVHPVIDGAGDAADDIAGLPSVGVVVPTYNDGDGVRELLAAVRAQGFGHHVVVVDDASTDERIQAVANASQAHFFRHDRNRGPAAARNTGWHGFIERFDIVVFLDADVVPATGALGRMLMHFVIDDRVGAVAPRVRARPGDAQLDRYESARSPLDMGDSPARVQPGGPVSYVPSAALAVRTSAMREIGGFDESLRVGEDVDLVWRLIKAGHIIRYEPAAVVEHRNRANLGALMRQRRSYGSAAAPLAERHPGDVAPIEITPQALAAWAVAILAPGRAKVGGVALAAGDAVGLARKLSGKVDAPVAETLRLSARGHAHAARWLAGAATRAWLPFFGVAVPFSRRGRRALAAAVFIPPLVEWFRDQPHLDPATYTALRAIDDASYCAGVWTGVVRSRNPRALLPRLRRRLGDGPTSRGR